MLKSPNSLRGALFLKRKAGMEFIGRKEILREDHVASQKFFL